MNSKSIWQTKSWQEMLKKSGQVSDFFEVEGIFIEKRRVALGEYGMFILGLNNEIKEETINKIIDLSKKENCLFLQIEDINYNQSLSTTFQVLPLEKEEIKEGYYKKFITPYTAVIDLELSQEDILAKMKPKGRYNIRLAEKKGVEISDVEITDENIKIFHELMMDTTSRDGFSGNNFQYYKDFLNNIPGAKLLIAYIEDIPVAAGIFVVDNEVSIYYYGASSSDKKYRKYMAPYLLQWKAITMAKEEGSKIYDFLGVAGPDEKDSSLAGVTDFKIKLTPDIRKVSNCYIFINKKIKYFIINILRKFK